MDAGSSPARRLFIDYFVIPVKAGIQLHVHC